MCGIAALLISSQNLLKFNQADIQSAVSNRGPNSTNTVTTEDNCWFVGSVLHIQGNQIVDQPYTDTDGNILLWNGEVFSGLAGFKVGVSDTIQVSSTLNKEIESAISGINIKGSPHDKKRMSILATQAVAECLSHINGPYAFIYYYKLLDLIIYGRDPFGRRSLLTLKLNGSIATVSSVCLSSNTSPVNSSETELIWQEVPVTGIFAYSTQRDSKDILHPFSACSACSLLRNSSDVHQLCSTCLMQKNLEDLWMTCDDLFVPWPVHRIRLGRRCLTSSNETNLCSENKKENEFNTEDKSEACKKNINSTSLSPSSQLLEVMLAAVRNRVSAVGFDFPPNNTVESGNRLLQCNKVRLCRIGVLFSGGIDSVVLAALLHLTLNDPDEPIELLNVAFNGSDAISEHTEVSTEISVEPNININEISICTDNTNNRKDGITIKDKNKEQPAPDRLAAVAALGELQKLYPTREWRLVHIDVCNHRLVKLLTHATIDASNYCYC
jgi:asparagine synthetase B (glutamine-hydrolysing)